MLRAGLLVLLILGATNLARADEPLADAARDGNVDALRSQLAAGANVNQRFDIGQSALIIAAQYGHLAAVRTLADKGADLNLRDNNGDTALHLAASYNQRTVVQFLLDTGADPRIKNDAGYDVLSYTQSLAARDSGLQPMVKYLADTIPKLPQVRAKGPDGVANSAVGEPALSVGYVTMDVSIYKATAEALRKAGRSALLRRGWKVIGTEPDRFVGSLVRRGQEYRVEIRYLPNQIRIAFLNGYQAERPNYLRNLEHDLQLELQVATPTP